MPSHSAGGSLMQALERAGREETVLAFPDDLSCGPIQGSAPAARADWWVWMYCGEPEDGVAEMQAFWDRVTTTDDELVVWWGRHSSRECAFFMALADRLLDRPFNAIDVTEVEYSFTGGDGSQILSQAPQEVSTMQREGLAGLLDTQKPVNEAERRDAALHWRQLRQENAPFRILSPGGLVSAPLDYFDDQILAQLSLEWQKVPRVLWNSSRLDERQHIQLSDYMAHKRLVFLVENGRVLADGDPRNTRTCRVRLPDPQ
jgi:hypothetical protein